jgi:putative oxidoreductase
MNAMRWLQLPPINGPRSIVLLRLMAGGVFLWEGALKFVYANHGVGRFLKLGFTEEVAHLIACFELIGGLALILGIFTRWTAIPFLIEMLVAMAVTKIGLYFGNSPLSLPPSPPQIGIWAVLHEIRSEYAQLLTVTFLAINGPGKWSLDAWLSNKKNVTSLNKRTEYENKMKPIEI